MIQKMLNHAQLADRFAAKIAILAVRFYQRHVSKHKGFSCAYNALNGEGSCSTIAVRVLSENTLSEAIPLIKHQFAECRCAMQKLRGDIIQDANESLERLGTFAVIGVVSCCGPSKDDNKKKPDPGPLGGTHQSSSTDIA